MILTLCGSTRFRKEFEQVAADLCLEGHVVFSLDVWGTEKDAGFIDDTNPLKVVLETVHLKKIDMSQGIVVINVAGYIGKSTRNEISYARRTDKQIFWYDALRAPLETSISHNTLSWETLKKAGPPLAKNPSEVPQNLSYQGEASGG